MKKVALSPTNRKKIVVALSGGVDSSVAAYLLHKKLSPHQNDDNKNAQVNELVGLFMNNWNELDEDRDSPPTEKLTNDRRNIYEKSHQKYCEKSEQDMKDAESVCDALHIKLHRANFTSDYWIDVFTPFVDEVEKGRMLNPDMKCNSKIKFGAMKEYAMSQLNATHIATGHYARLWYRSNDDDFLGEYLSKSSSSFFPSANRMPSFVEEGLKKEDGSNDWIETWGLGSSSSFSYVPKESSSPSLQKLCPLLLAAADSKKDQSYFLSDVKGSAFQNVLFPLGDLLKINNRNQNHNQNMTIHEGNNDPSPLSVREIAAQAKLPNATKRESMGICFIGKRRFPNFISEYIHNKPPPGYFICVDTQRVVGSHDGSGHLLTIGQGAKISGASQKWFVCDKDYSNGNVTVCERTHHPALYSNELYVRMNDWNWIGMEMPLPLLQGNNIRGLCRIRHLQPLLSCNIMW